MPEQAFPFGRQQPSSELRGIHAQVGQPWWGFIVGLIVGLTDLIGTLTFFWLFILWLLGLLGGLRLADSFIFC